MAVRFQFISIPRPSGNTKPSSTVSRANHRPAFTLIELLVVVAIIALLIAILLPSLSKARAQARTTLCASRLGQLTKAVLLYADDHNETPPFVGRGWEDCDDTARLTSEEWPSGSGQTLWDLAMAEDWLMPGMPEYWLDEPAVTPWPEHATVRNGSLFSYTRFEKLYLCPEFERIQDSRKSQNIFNYTRTVLARKWFHHGDPEGDPPSPYMPTGASNNWCGIAGPLLKISQVHAPAKMWMFLDEKWDRHCAAPADMFGVAGTPGSLFDTVAREMWMAIDCCWGPWGDEIGQYHGVKRLSPLIPQQLIDDNPGFFVEALSGSCAFYDSHVELDLDPLPGRTARMDMFAFLPELLGWVHSLIYAQRGIAPDQIIFDALSF